MDSSIVVPIALWNSSQPIFRISSICVTPNFGKLITGTHDGVLCMWDLNVENGEIHPKILIFGHNSSVTCLVCTNDFLISTCEGGKMCRWNFEDGYCQKKKFPRNSQWVHRKAQLLRRKSTECDFLFTCGDYSGVRVYHSVTLQLICNFFSKTDCDWISNFFGFLKSDIEEIVVVGVTFSGCTKTWLFNNSLNQLQHELICKRLEIEGEVVDFTLGKYQSLALIVMSHSWILLDSEFSAVIQQFTRMPHEEKLSGGKFMDSDIIIWGSSGTYYVYGEINNTYELKIVSVHVSNNISLLKMAMTVDKSDKNDCFYFLKGSHQGKLNIYLVKGFTSSPVHKLNPVISVMMKQEWGKFAKGFFESIIKTSSVTCSTYVSLLDRFFLGCLNGQIIIVPAMQSLFFVYLSLQNELPPCERLIGHRGKVNCIVYPHETHSHHDRSFLVSGSNDFSVCLWDIHKSALLHRFCVHGGEILRLLVPPDTFHSQVKYSICSVASDHSVAILDLVNQRCLVMASSHAYPVVSVHWKPLDGFLLVECYDGSVFVWETETGFLDRILDGVHAQEVLYACKESISNETTPSPSSTSLLNFYICDRILKNSLKFDLFEIECEHQRSESPVKMIKFLTSRTSQSQILTCHLERIIKKIIAMNDESQDGISDEKLYYLTQALGPEVSKKSFIYLNKSQYAKTEKRQSEKTGEKEENEGQEKRSGLQEMETILKFLLSSLHVWGLDSAIDNLVSESLGLVRPKVIPPLGIISSSGIYTLFLSSDWNNLQRRSSSLMAITCIIIMATSKVLKSVSFRTPNRSLNICQSVKSTEKENPWDELYEFYEKVSSNGHGVVPHPRMEILAKFWQNKCMPIRNTIQKLLPNHLGALVQQDYLDLLKFWYDFLPHFKVRGKIVEKKDFDNGDLKTVALVLFGTVGSDLKFKANFPPGQDNYIYQTCSSLVYLLLMPNAEDGILKDLQTTAIDFIGRGYVVWEQFLKVEKIYPILFQMCNSMLKKKFGGLCQGLDKSMAALEALKAIALSRTSAFIKCLMMEITGTPGSQPRFDGFTLENSKPEVLSIIVFLMEKTPYIMLLYLNEVVSILVYCIDSSHLKQENLSDLLPVMCKFRQVDHLVSGQKVAVGLGTGSVILHDLRSGKTVSVSGHNDSIAAVKFSEDGKYLASYSSYENRLILWQVLTGMFGLGQIQLKLFKSYATPPIYEEDIKNHMEVAKIKWSSNKFVNLKLCDGTEMTFPT